MDKKIYFLLTLFFSLNFLTPALAKSADDFDNSALEEDLDEEDEDEEKERRKQEEKKRKKQAEIQRKKELLKERRNLESQNELDALRDAQENTTSYKVNPDSVRLMVDLDPGSFGFKGRDHRMDLMLDVDLILRGRLMARYDYRFFEFVTLGIKAGLDSTDFSLVSKLKQQLNKPAPKQQSVLAGASMKLRLTEWYLNSAVYLEPSFLVGRLWQTLLEQKTTHWRLKPGGFLGIETVFDTGFAMNIAVGGEGTFDFGKPNPIKEGLEPVFLIGFGLAI